MAARDPNEDRHTAARSDVDHVGVAGEREVGTGRLGQEHVAEVRPAPVVQVGHLDHVAAVGRRLPLDARILAQSRACRRPRSRSPPWRRASARPGRTPSRRGGRRPRRHRSPLSAPRSDSRRHRPASPNRPQSAAGSLAGLAGSPAAGGIACLGCTGSVVTTSGTGSDPPPAGRKPEVVRARLQVLGDGKIDQSGDVQSPGPRTSR